MDKPLIFRYLWNNALCFVGENVWLAFFTPAIVYFVIDLALSYPNDGLLEAMEISSLAPPVMRCREESGQNVESEFVQEKSVPFLLLGLAAVSWAGYSLITGRGYYKGCPPGGFDRTNDPFNFWAPTIIILGIGVCMILIFLGIIPLPLRSR